MFWEIPIKVHFTRSMYKLMLSDPLTLADLEAVDIQLYNSLKYIIECEDVSETFVGTTFTTQREVA